MTERDAKRLIGCDQRLIQKVDRVLEKMAAEGHPMQVTSGARSVLEQAALYAQGRTAPGRIVTYADGVKNKSNHQSGRACDCAFVVNGKPSWDESLPWEMFAETAQGEGLTAGFYWKRQDKPHIELPSEDTTGAVKV